MTALLQTEHGSGWQKNAAGEWTVVPGYCWCGTLAKKCPEPKRHVRVSDTYLIDEAPPLLTPAQPAPAGPVFVDRAPSAAGGEPERTEHQVVVVFDVTAGDRLSAARAVVGVLGGTRGRYVLDGGVLASTVVESWWFPEADLKQVDRNDNAAMHLEQDDL